MSVVTIRVSNTKHQRLKHLAKTRGISVNKLIEVLATEALAQHDTEMRFRSLAARGSAKRGLSLLDKLDRAFARNSRG
jgi:predicted DNA-binding ribbon-helix-helix protein